MRFFVWRLFGDKEDDDLRPPFPHFAAPAAQSWQECAPINPARLTRTAPVTPPSVTQHHRNVLGSSVRSNKRKARVEFISLYHSHHKSQAQLSLLHNKETRGGGGTAPEVKRDIYKKKKPMQPCVEKQQAFIIFVVNNIMYTHRFDPNTNIYFVIIRMKIWQITCFKLKNKGRRLTLNDRT